MKYSKKAQNILEYTILLCIILSSLLIMQFFIRRSYQGRLKQEADNIGPQYSPFHTGSSVIMNTSTDTYSYTGGTTQAEGIVPGGKNIPEGMTVTWSQTRTSSDRRETVDSFAKERE